jgi:hypothetical protein
MAISPLYRAIGAHDAAIHDCLTVLDEMPDLDATIRQVVYFQLTRAYAQQGDVKAADVALTRGRAEAESENFFRIYLPREDLIAEAEIGLAGREYAQALAASERQIELVHNYGARAYLAEPLFLKGKSLAGLERYEEAFETLSLARFEAETMDQRRVLWPILALLSQIEKLRGNATEALELAEEALDVVTYIADNIVIEEQRRLFLEQPEVQELRA